ncbi:MAG TPA: GMC family oxidoreductase N-terminal domain-containing protein [Solirubrobacteraceae bacterium]|nr:GMC family oxidoreductase N-terminal domain-containing protein [Solirubrobacteraceae bacterium]
MSGCDYVIVGAGSAGCVLANRLSEDPGTRVLVLEAGGRDRSPNIKIPAAFGKQFHSKLDWDYWTEPEPHLDGRSLYMPRGRSLGGSSSMNAMLYVRGRPLDYAGWEAQGAPGWGWEDVLPAFIRAESNSRGASEWHGADGPLRVTEPRSPRPIARLVLEASVAAGIPYTRDYNGPEQDGVSLFQVLQSGGRRFSAADAYLHPVAHRPNLEIRTGAEVLGLDLSGERVTGVHVRRGRRGEEVIPARREVLLCAGAIGSPQLLQLSGIGAAEDLRAVGIEPRHELPGVGGNLQDHPVVAVLYAVRAGDAGDTLFTAERPRNLAEWLLRGSGPLTSTVAEVCAFVRTRPGLPAADIQFHVAPAYFEAHGAETHDGHALTFGPTLLTPRARGRVWLRSADPRDKPRILTNTLSEPEDVDSLLAGVRLARRIAATDPLAQAIARELKPGAAAVDDEELIADLRARTELLYHPCGTCRMSDTAPEAVVDSRLRVHGLQGIRVVDASIMPTVPGGNTHAPTVMIAERASDLIREREPVAN